jgi:hypothetical protein
MVHSSHRAKQSGERPVLLSGMFLGLGVGVARQCVIQVESPDVAAGLFRTHPSLLSKSMNGVRAVPTASLENATLSAHFSLGRRAHAAVAAANASHG